MATDITKTLRKALADLEKQRAHIDTQIVALKNALAAVAPGGRGQLRGRRAKTGKPQRKPMSAAARKAVGKRMKAYWAKRKAEALKGRGESGK